MRFQKSTMGYLKLGIIFTIFGIIPAFIITIIGFPLLTGGILVGGITGLTFTSMILLVIFFLVQGWFVYWFVTSNKWK